MFGPGGLRFCMAADALAPGLGRGAQLFFIPPRQAPVVEQLLAGDPKVFHAVAAGGVNKLRNRVVDRLLCQAGQVESDDVGGFADFQRADFSFDSQRAGTVERGHAQGAVATFTRTTLLSSLLQPEPSRTISPAARV